MERKATVVESAYEQWRWLELMRKRVLGAEPDYTEQRRLGWRVKKRTSAWDRRKGLRYLRKEPR